MGCGGCGVQGVWGWGVGSMGGEGCGVYNLSSVITDV